MVTRSLRFCLFAHSWVSDWNHGNAHFLRGLARALARAGHIVRCYEPKDAWSRYNLLRNEGERGIRAVAEFHRVYPELDVRFYESDRSFSGFADRELREADVVIVHEWNDPAIVNAILESKGKLGFRVLLHDTHHRAYTNPREILRFELQKLDGVLAFGEAICRIYADAFGVPRAWVLHEAADTSVFCPVKAEPECDLTWIGNWGDDERTQELHEFLVAPAAALRERRIVAYGVRYPENALNALAAAGVQYRGYLPNVSTPEIYGRSWLALHVPRRQYANGLSGIPTIRVFEALACGIPLLCSPWADGEGLFVAGVDYIQVRDGEAMKNEIACLLNDDIARRQLAEAGLKTIRQRHTCAHRAEQLVEICEDLQR